MTALWLLLQGRSLPNGLVVALVALLAGGWSLSAVQVIGLDRDLARTRLAVKAAEAEAVGASLRRVQRDQDIAQRFGTQAAQRQADIVARTRALTQEIVRYVPIETDRRCGLPGSARGLLDASARGGDLPAPAPAAARPDSDPAGTADDADGQVSGDLGGRDTVGWIIETHGVCHQIRDQLIGLQGWVAEVVAE